MVRPKPNQPDHLLWPWSTVHCTGVLKHVVAKYIQHGSSAYACFIDASKAFDLVRHGILFELLLSRSLPSLVM